MHDTSTNRTLNWVGRSLAVLEITAHALCVDGAHEQVEREEKRAAADVAGRARKVQLGRHLCFSPDDGCFPLSRCSGQS